MKKDKEYYQNNKEKCLKRDREYYQNNKGKAFARHKKYCQNNKEKISAIQRKCRNTDKGREVVRNARHKRRVACKETDITTNWLLELRKESIYCQLCGVEMNNINYDSKQAQLDHIIPLNIDGKHVMKNVRFICFKCNRKRPKDGSDADILKGKVSI